MIPHPVAGHARSDRGHHAGEVGAQRRQPALEGRITAERDEDVGEVDAGRADGDLDLSGSRWNAVAGNEFE